MKENRMFMYHMHTDPIHQVNQFKDQPVLFVMNHTDQELKAMFRSAVTSGVDLANVFSRIKETATAEQKKRMSFAHTLYVAAMHEAAQSTVQTEDPIARLVEHPRMFGRRRNS